MWKNGGMNRPSKKEIKAALDQLKSPTTDENNRPSGESKGGHLPSKMANRRIRQNKV
jgi:hypothetical protein